MSTASSPSDQRLVLGGVSWQTYLRVLRSFDLYQPWRMTPFAEGRLLKADKLGVLSYFVLLPFAAFGARLLRRSGWALLILLAPVAMVVLQSALGYGFPRFRHPADLVMVVLGALAVVRLLDRRAAVRTSGSPA